MAYQERKGYMNNSINSVEIIGYTVILTSFLYFFASKIAFAMHKKEVFESLEDAKKKYFDDVKKFEIYVTRERKEIQNGKEEVRKGKERLGLDSYLVYFRYGTGENITPGILPISGDKTNSKKITAFIREYYRIPIQNKVYIDRIVQVFDENTFVIPEKQEQKESDFIEYEAENCEYDQYTAIPFTPVAAGAY